MNANLQAKLEAFLAEFRSNTTEGYAEVTEEDITQLCELWFALLRAKFAPDMDGDMPLEATFVDRNKHQRMHYFPIPYPRLAKDDISKVMEILSLANTNLSIAQRQVDQTIGHLGFLIDKEGPGGL